MYNITFSIGAPYPTQRIGTAVTMYDDPGKALEDAYAKAATIAKILEQHFRSVPAFEPPVEDDRDYVDGKLSEAARQRLAGEAELALWGPHPLPSRDVSKHRELPTIEIQLASDDLQLPLIVVPRAQLPRQKDPHDTRASGDYQARILLSFSGQKVELGRTEYANTSASRALSQATEQARAIVTHLKKEPKLGFLSFNAITIEVDRINTQIDLSDEPADEFDWRHMEYPQPRF